jgi:hypothetical protein
MIGPDPESIPTVDDGADGIIGVHWRDSQKLWEIRYRINGVEEVETRKQRAAAYRLANRLQAQIRAEGSDASCEPFDEALAGKDHRQSEFWLDFCGQVALKLAANPNAEELHRLARVVGSLAGHAKKHIPERSRDPGAELGAKSDEDLAEVAVSELSGLVSGLPEATRERLAKILTGKT